MKNKIKYIVFLLLFITVFVLVFKFDVNSTEKHHKRPYNISKTAIWSGGADGGYWFDFIDYNKKTNEYSFIIYDENNGKIILNGKFIKNGNCNSLPIDIEILKKIDYFANDEIVLDECVLLKCESD